MIRASKLVIVTIFSVIFVIELAVRFLPVENFAEPLDYILITSGRKLHSVGNEFETILLGDSASMAIESPYQGASFYNFSVPYIGNRYYSTIYKSYIKKNKPPENVIFALHPHLLLIAMERPVDSLNYADGEGWQAFRTILSTRLNQSYLERQSNDAGLAANPFADYRNRTLLFTDYADSVSMYRGMDWFVQSYNALPALYRTYFYRSAILNFLSSKGSRSDFGCMSCDDIYKKQCTNQLKPGDRTLLIEKHVAKGGSFNLDDLTTTKSRFYLQMLRDPGISGLVDTYGNANVAVDTRALEEVVAAVAESNARFIYLELPMPTAVFEASHTGTFRKTIQDVLAKYPNTQYVQFPNLAYPADDFIDPLHFSCYGALKLNQDWKQVYSRIIDN